MTVGLILANVLAFFFLQPGLGNTAEANVYFIENAPIPCQLEESCEFDAIQVDPSLPPTPIPDRGLFSFLQAILLSTFLHAGLLHIGGNMLFLWVFGNNIEDHLGRLKYLLFYLAAGFAAAFAHILTHSNSVAPTVGASGAVAGVMGAYILLYPRAKVNVLIPIFILWTVVRWPAIAVLGLWIVFQLWTGYQETSGAVSVAWMAHVGGFVFGIAAMFLLGGRPQRPRIEWEPQWGRY